MPVKKILKQSFSIVIILATLITQISYAEDTFQGVWDNLSSSKEDNNYPIYSDSSKGFIMYFSDGKLGRLLNGETKRLDSTYEANSYYVVGWTPLQEAYTQVSVSPDKNIIIFYDVKGKTYSFNIKKDELQELPFSFGEPVWNASESDIEFMSSKEVYVEGMATSHINPIGLSIKESDGSFKRILEENKYVYYKSRSGNLVYFKTTTGIGFDGLYNQYSEELAYNEKTCKFSYVPYLPDGCKEIDHKKISDYPGIINRLSGAGMSRRIYTSGNYAVAVYNSGYARYNIKTKTKAAVSAPIGAYKGFTYYFKNPSGNGEVDKMNIASLSKSKTSIGYAASYGIYFLNNYLYFMNPQKSKNGEITDVPYALNLDINKLIKNLKAPDVSKEYHVFKLSNGNRLCLDSSGSRLEQPNGHVILTNPGYYYGGNFFQISKDGKRMVINKINAEGKLLKTLYKTGDYASISDLIIYNSRVFFTAGGNMNLYSCNLVGGNLIKY